jgi:predicted GNAT family acetyltransferase
MEVMHFKDARKFQSRVLEYLAKNEAENNLILGILANLIGGDYSGNPPYLAVIEDAGVIQAVSLCTPPWPALISYQDPPPAKDVLKVILDDMQASLQDDFIGFSANKEFASRLIAQWEENTGKEAILEMSMRIYKLEAVQAVSGVPGEMRLVKEEERELVEDWFVGFHREALREEPDLTRIKKMVNAYLSSEPHLRGLMIWETIGQPVSMAGYAGPTPNGIRIGAVYTPPEMRKQGYASAVTAGLSQYLLDQGYRFCFLFTDLLNPTSNHIYQQIGYQPVCDVDRYMFG